MKRRFLWATVLALMVAFYGQTPAEAGVNISLPPFIVFSEPPELVVIPETDIYVVPALDEDIFFYKGWWWRLWEEKWYRSRNYNSRWVLYSKVPSFYKKVPFDWRKDYRAHLWKGYQWNYQLIPNERVEKNWRDWEKGKYWERHDSWGVPDLKRHKRVIRSRHRAVEKKAQGKQQPQELRRQPQHGNVPQQKRKVQPQTQKREELRPSREREVPPPTAAPR